MRGDRHGTRARGHRARGRETTGGHAALHALLPRRSEYGRIGTWLTDHASKNCAHVLTGIDVEAEKLDGVLETYRPDHVVVATGARGAADGFQGWTAQPLPGIAEANTATWEQVPVLVGGDDVTQVAQVHVAIAGRPVI